MVLATCADGRPSARTVLLKGVSDGGFTFFTNYDSRKGAEIAGNPAVACTSAGTRCTGRCGSRARPPGHPGGVRGVLRQSAEGFATRRLGVGPVSVVSALGDLTTAYADAEARFAGEDVPCPDHWGGYQVAPTMIEFWLGQPSRMHDRLAYRRTRVGWTLIRLAP